jgi:NSS family neurotransmitter:Na+ symporter
MGQLFAIILYIAMLFAGISSLQNMFEAVGESLMRYIPKLSRSMMLVVLGIICLGIGVFMEPIYKWGPWMDIVSIYIIPIGATIGAISWFWIMKKEDLMEEINRGAKKPHGDKWYFAGKFLVVGCAIILCACALILKIAF